MQIPAFPSSGNPKIDSFLAQDYLKLRGMSSRFSAGICAHLMRRQSELGITGGLVEIGTFEGRFFIALALGLMEAEPAIGIDSFDWPDSAIIDRFRDNYRQHGLSDQHISTWKTNTSTITAADLRARLKASKARFIHIDGDHSPKALKHDLELADAVLHEQGLICLDDMLHPSYPFLVATVQEFLAAHSDYRVLCIIDREDIVGAAKFLLCRMGAIAQYEADLMSTFSPYHFVLGGDALGHHCVVLTPEPKLAIVD